MKTRLAFVSLVVMALNIPLFGSSISQIAPISWSQSGTSSSTIGADILVTGLQPFDSGLGTLTSFEFSWVMTLTGSATTDENPPEFIFGNVNASAFFISSSFYAGGSGSGSAGSGDPDTPFGFSFDVTNDTIFQVADAGVSYNAFILDTVTGNGPNPYPADLCCYQFHPNFSIPWTAGATGSLTVTYNYDAVAAPEPSTFALLSAAFLVAGIVFSRRRTA